MTMRAIVLSLALAGLAIDFAQAAPCDVTVSKADAFVREANQSVGAAARRNEPNAVKQAAHYCGAYGRLLGAYEALRTVAGECLKSDQGASYRATIDKTVADMTAAFERSCR